MGVYTEAVQKLYVAYFSRPADAAGLAYWENVVTANKGNTAAVSAAFAASQEYKDTFAGQSAYQTINTIYLNLFGRPAEPEGLTYWGQLLMTGKVTIDNAVTAIAGGAQGTDKDAYANKVAAATAFTAALDTSAEMIGYSGAAANAAAKTWLAGITTEATLKAAVEPAALNGTVNGVVNPPVIGQTYTVGAAVDTLVGTSANDTFNALSVDATGAANSTLTAFDNIDGGAGTDTINVYTTATENTGIPASATVKNIEIVNLFNTSTNADEQFGTTAAVNAGQFAGATQIWQIGAANNNGVSGLAATTTAGFRNLTLDTTGAITVAAASGAASANIALDAVKGNVLTNAVGLNTTGTSTVNVSGTIVKADAAVATAANLALGVTAVKDAQTVTVNSAVATTLSVSEAAGSAKMITTVNAAGSTGAITFVGDADVTTINTGNGADTVTVAATTAKATDTAAAIDASVSTGAGKDTITIKATGTGAVTVDAGAGDDTVTLDGAAVRTSGKLTVNLGDGADKFSAIAGAAVAAGDVIDAGAGIDTLSLNLVGAANIGAFSNFDIFDTAALARTLDVDILSSKNTVTEFIASGDVGVGATLTNIGAGVGVRITGDMAGSTLVANQKTAGALTVTVDADETGDADDAGETVTGALTTNATSVKAVFDVAYLADTTAEKALALTADNYTTLTLTAAAATSLEVVSGGANASNNINVTTNSDKLASITVSGAQSLTIGTVTGATKLLTIDASASTGGLIAGTDDVANGGTIKLGTGVDVITVAATSTAAAAENVSGFEKAAAAAVGSDATAAAAAQADADTLVFASGVVANANAGVTTGTIAKGVLTFTGAGPADLAAAFAIANAAADGEGEVVVFEYLGNSYVFQQLAAGDVAVKLVGVTGVTQIAEIGTTDGFFLV